MNRPLITLLLALVITGGARTTPVLAAGTDPAGARDRTPNGHTAIGTSDMRLAQGRGRDQRKRRGDGAEGRQRSGEQKGHREFHKKMNDVHRSWHREHGGRQRGGANKGGDGPGQGAEERRERRGGPGQGVEERRKLREKFRGDRRRKRKRDRP